MRRWTATVLVIGAAAIGALALAGTALGAQGGKAACSNGIHGSASGNAITGTASDDQIHGHGGNDRLYGRAGADCVHGGGGNDVLRGGAGEDELHGGPGSDVVLAADGEADTVDCGPGADTVTADAGDQLTGCETSVAPPTAQLGSGGGDITTRFDNRTSWRLQWVSVDDQLHCANSVDHPWFEPHSSGSTSFVASGRYGCASAVAVWDMTRPDGVVVATVTAGYGTIPVPYGGFIVGFFWKCNLRAPIAACTTSDTNLVTLVEQS